MNKPKVFIGSSSEGIQIAKELEVHLAKECHTYIWTSGDFKLSHSFLEDLERMASEYEYAVLILSPDDIIESKGVESYSPRDNVLFELGLFVGKLSRFRTFIVCDPKKIKLPSDWNGITVARFDWERAIEPTECRAALSPTSTEILDAIKSTPIPSRKHSSKESYFDKIPEIDELYKVIVGTSANRNGIIICHSDTTWAWKLFPTILEWRCRSIPMNVILLPIHGGDKFRRQEKYRRNLLENIGVNVIEAPEVPFKGFFLNSNDDENLDVLILSEDISGYQPLATRYSGNEHREATIALLKSLPDFKYSKVENFIPQIEEHENNTVIKILTEGVTQYRGNGINIEYTKIPTKDLLMISKYTRAYKYNQISYLNDRYLLQNIQPFTSLQIKLKDESFSIATPPVVESRKEGFVVIEGNTRATYFYKNDIKEFPCILVEGVQDLPPSSPIAINQIIISERTLLPDQRMNNFNYNNFRHIERAIHPY